MSLPSVPSLFVFVRLFVAACASLYVVESLRTSSGGHDGDVETKTFGRWWWWQRASNELVLLFYVAVCLGSLSLGGEVVFYVEV